MPLPWTVALVAVVVVALTLRITLRQLPLVAAKAISGPQAAALAVGVIGLVAHCGAMFFTGVVSSVPGSGPYVDAVNGMGTTSQILYAVPALLVVAGLWRVGRPALSVVVVLLVVVGVTMYDGGPLTVHLTAILLVVVALAMTVAGLVGRRHEDRLRV
ncbi:MAG: hypothetical protein ABI083_07495 [Lapillicoccus sp.]